MADHKILLASVILFLSIFSSLASYPPATNYLISTCNDATYGDLCLQTLLPDVGRINSTPKKSTHLAILATITAVQSASNSITQLSKQPQLWSRELGSVNDCGTSISNTVALVNTAMETTDHLGGGDKNDKESKRLSMENNVKAVVSATNTCITNLQDSRARDDVISRVQDATKLLVYLATNAIDLIDRMQF